MPARLLLATVAAGVFAVLASIPAPVCAVEDKKDDLKKRTEEAVERGLEWLKRTQAQDGHWEAQGGQYPTAMTALAGMCFLMEGSTLKEGKYSDQIQKTVDWFLKNNRQQATGLLGDVRNPIEQTRYMYGHGFGTMFLASVYGEEEDKEQREKLEKALKKAVEFIGKAQTTRKHRKPEGKEVEIGGWGYVSATDNNQFDEGSVTVTQVQALRAARNAGIPVPKETIDKAVAYLEACTTPRGGLIYSYANSGGNALNGQERCPSPPPPWPVPSAPGSTRANWPRSGSSICKDNIAVARDRVNHDEYQSYYFSQCVYVLGEDRYGELLPQRRQEHLAHLEQVQGGDVPLPHRQPGQEHRFVERRLRRPGARDLRQPRHPPVG